MAFNTARPSTLWTTAAGWELKPRTAVLMLALALFAALDSWRRARTAEPGGWRKRLGVAAGVIALGAGLALVPGEPLAWRSFYAPSGSMIPALLVGDRFVVQEGWYEANPVRRGERTRPLGGGGGVDVGRRAVLEL